MHSRLIRTAATVAALLMAAVLRADAQSSLSGDTIHISRAAGPINIDGDLSDEGWRGATRVDKWYETQPGDNTEPKVRNVGYLTYDDHFLYAAFEFDDPDLKAIRAPFADIGLSFIGVIATDREANSGGSHNRVVGPDFQWRPSSSDVVTGQLLYSESRTP